VGSPVLSRYYAPEGGPPSHELICFAGARCGTLGYPHPAVSHDSTERQPSGAQRFAAILQAAAFACSSWVAFYPVPYDVAVLLLASLPLVALAALATRRDIWRFAAWREEQSVGLTTVILLPGIALAYRARDWDLRDGAEALWLAGVVGAVLLALLCWLSRDLRRQPFVVGIAGILVAVYAYGAIVHANVVLDAGEPQAERVSVVGRRVLAPGVRAERYLRVERAGESAPGRERLVSQPLFSAARRREAICAMVRPGALGIAWQTLERCPVDGSPR
jgi:hypothetical protein